MSAEAQVTVLLFIVGLAFYAGVLANRVSSLEQWRDGLSHTLDAIHSSIRGLENLIRDGDDAAVR